MARPKVFDTDSNGTSNSFDVTDSLLLPASYCGMFPMPGLYNWPFLPSSFTGGAASAAGTGTASGSGATTTSSLSPETITYAGSGIVFMNTYGSGVTTAFRNEIVAAENYLQAHFTNSCTIRCNFDLQSLSQGISGENSFNEVVVSYSTLVNALASHATSSDDSAAVAALQKLSDPSGGKGFALSTTEARILGLAPAGTGGTDDSVVLNSYYWSSTALQNYPNDAIDVVLHEITEGAFGRIGALGLDGYYWEPMDLFRFNASGQRDFTGGKDGVATYFSIDGTNVNTGLQYHNSVNAAGQFDGYDLADWDGVGADSNYNDPFGPGGPGAGGSGQLSATDLRILDVLGWTSTPVGAPDLIVSGITLGASTVAQGGSLSFSYVIKNQGSATAGGSYSSWQIDSAPTVGSGSVSDAVGSLAVGASASFSDSISIPTTLSVGTHTLWVDADNWNGVSESNESNNWSSVTFTVTAPPQPDLVVSGLAAGASVQQGTALSFSYAIKNQGTGSAGSNYSAWAVDAKPTTSSLVWDSVNPLGAGASSSTFSHTLDTSSLSVGTHTLWVEADYWNNQVSESDETNNWSSVTFSVTPPPPSPRPDLIVSGLAAAASVQQGTALSFSYAIKNQGTASAGSNYSAWAVDAKPTTSSPVWDSVSPLGPGASSAAFSHSVATSGLSIGTHTLWVEADYWNNQVSESDETNNWSSVTFSVTAPPPSPQPDLIVSGLAAAASVQQGTALSFSYAIKNQGTASAGGNYSAWSVDAKPTASSPVWDAVNPLGAGASSSTFSHNLDTSSLSVGTHTLWVEADYWDNQVSESNETNNWSSVTFTVTAPPPVPQPDLIVRGLTVGASVQQGTALSFSYAIKNQGTASAGSNYSAWAVDAKPTTFSPVWDSVSALGAGISSGTFSHTLSTSSLSVGTHTLWVAADYWNNQVSESDETNNWSSVTFTVTASPQPDLIVSGLTAGTSVQQGTALSFSYAIKNQGTASAGSNYSAWSVDAKPTTSSPVWDSVSPLAAGASSSTFSHTLDTSSLSIGTHTLWVEADYWNNQVSESDETNNWSSVTFTVTARQGSGSSAPPLVSSVDNPSLSADAPADLGLLGQYLASFVSAPGCYCSESGCAPLGGGQLPGAINHDTFLAPPKPM